MFLSYSYAVNNEGVFMGPTPGPYILQLCMGRSYFWRGLFPPNPPYFTHWEPVMGWDRWGDHGWRQCDECIIIDHSSSKLTTLEAVGDYWHYALIVKW